ncbi:hypothetical protein ABE28_003285 [Peribacillus muralis]|uniref:Uncharacterized protein n=1 Tax=Peribacillus muralis TaxID=264697 RepID=A0A1B3XJI5_9BACI|nr:hypothetical protein [Peribacillus muralis]AOH53363.1 hypothetical protein ABE28_003285 [Peribacillus muralis]
MKSIKCIVLVASLFLINYVGGVPGDLKNLFITHTIFLTPYILELHKFLLVKFDNIVYWIVRIIYGLGCTVLITNILGIFGILTMNAKKSFVINKDYSLPVPFSIGYDRYILIATLIYVAIFMVTILFDHLVYLQVNANKEESEKENIA